MISPQQKKCVYNGRGLAAVASAAAVGDDFDPLDVGLFQSAVAVFAALGGQGAALVTQSERDR